MRNARVLTALGLLAAAGAAHAGVSSTWTVTNDYDFRSYSQSAKDPALQASLDYAHDSGWYVGAWASNVDFGTSDPDLELDLYTGFSKSFDNKFGYDVGVVYYTYHASPDPSGDFYEAYAGVSYDWVKAKAFYSPDFGGSATSGNTSAQYIQVDAAVPLPANFSVLGHVGYSWGDYWDKSVTDYSAGVGYTAGNFSLALKYVDNDTSKSDGTRTTEDVFNNEGRVIFTVSTTFPCGE
ncbi:MAG TPA: TorF family putative porin [Steroidobacteraceae bacterium]|nr:TorF family putative porin [Steroidobacteraceae bacterium]